MTSGREAYVRGFAAAISAIVMVSSACGGAESTESQVDNAVVSTTAPTSTATQPDTTVGQSPDPDPAATPATEVAADSLATNGDVVWATVGSQVFAIDAATAAVIDVLDWGDPFCDKLWTDLVQFGVAVGMFDADPGCDPNDPGQKRTVAYSHDGVEMFSTIPDTPAGQFLVTVALSNNSELAVVSAFPAPGVERVVVSDDAIHLVAQTIEDVGLTITARRFGFTVLSGDEAFSPGTLAAETRSTTEAGVSAMGLTRFMVRGMSIPTGGDTVVGTNSLPGTIITIDSDGRPQIHLIDGLTDIRGEGVFLDVAGYQGEAALFLSVFHGGLCDEVEYFAIDPVSIEVLASWIQETGQCVGIPFSAGMNTYLMAPDGKVMYTLTPEGGGIGTPRPLGDNHQNVLQLGDAAFIAAHGGASLIDEEGARLGCPIGGIDQRSPAVVTDSGLVYAVADGIVTALDPTDCG